MAFIFIALVFFTLFFFMPAIPFNEGGSLPLGVAYFLLADVISKGYYDNLSVTLLWIFAHLYLSITPAWIIIRVLKRRIKRKAEQAVAGYDPQVVAMHTLPLAAKLPSTARGSSPEP